MMNWQTFGTAIFTVIESSQVGEVRRFAQTLGERLGFGPVATENCAIIVNELAKNLVKHSGEGGRIIVQPCERHSEVGVEIISIDKGRGMQNVEACLADGFSSAGTLGQGMGAVKRLSSEHGEFDIYSAIGQGTIVVAKIFAHTPTATKYSTGTISLPKEGESICGDAFAIVPTSRGVAMAVVDGLGHGYDASVASQAIIKAFVANCELEAAELLREMHRGAAGTRGAVGAVATINDTKKIMQFAGLGNINAVAYDFTKTKHLLSHNGTLGYEARRFEQFELPWNTASMLIMHSDGCSHRWNLDQYEGIMSRKPSTIAALLYRDHGKAIDDVTICALRY